MLFQPYLSQELPEYDEMPAAAKLLYVLTQTRAVGSVVDLARGAGIGKRTAYRLVKILKKHKWIRVERQGRISVVIPVIPPSEDNRRAKVLKTCCDVARFRGEYIMGRLVDATVILEGRVDNARPDFLKSPLSGDELEYDIFSPVTMDGIEFNGFQHSGTTEIQQSKDKAKMQEANDLMKIGRSVQNKVNLVIMTYKDLSVDGVLRKLPEHLPRRAIDRKSKYIRTLESMAGNYREWCSRKEAELQAKRKMAEQDELTEAMGPIQGG